VHSSESAHDGSNGCSPINVARSTGRIPDTSIGLAIKLDLGASNGP
jgi:hypothetical protein